MLITISRQYGAGGSEVARQVAAARSIWRVLDNELIEEVARRAGVSAEQIAEKEERAPSFVERLARTLAASTLSCCRGLCPVARSRSSRSAIWYASPNQWWRRRPRRAGWFLSAGRSRGPWRGSERVFT